MHKASCVRRHWKAAQDFHLDTSRPGVAFYLHQANVRGTDTDDIPRAQTGRTSAASISRRFEQLIVRASDRLPLAFAFLSGISYPSRGFWIQANQNSALELSQPTE